jgi:hypothetical protein
MRDVMSQHTMRHSAVMAGWSAMLPAGAVSGTTCSSLLWTAAVSAGSPAATLLPPASAAACCSSASCTALTSSICTVEFFPCASCRPTAAKPLDMHSYVPTTAEVWRLHKIVRAHRCAGMPHDRQASQRSMHRGRSTMPAICRGKATRNAGRQGYRLHIGLHGRGQPLDWLSGC